MVYFLCQHVSHHVWKYNIVRLALIYLALARALAYALPTNLQTVQMYAVAVQQRTVLVYVMGVL